MGLTKNTILLRIYRKWRAAGISHKKALKMFPKRYREKVNRMKAYA